jgi:hypothetical protein
VVVEPVEVDAHRPQADQRQRVSAASQDGAELVEALQQPLRDRAAATHTALST